MEHKWESSLALASLDKCEALADRVMPPDGGAPFPLRAGPPLPSAHPRNDAAQEVMRSGPLFRVPLPSLPVTRCPSE